MSILIARHGETDSNARRIIQMPDTPLSARGIEQARKLAQRIKQKGITRLISSDYLRTHQTAEQIAKICDIEIEYNPLLRERNFGDLRGQSYDFLEQDPFAPDYVPPKGESWFVFNQRVAEAWTQICRAAANTQGNAMFVTHGLVCRSLYQEQCSMPSDLRDLSNYANTALTEITAKSPWTIRRLNCTSHLQDSAEMSLGAPV